MVLFAWTSPGAQAQHIKAAAQLAFVTVKELTVIFIGTGDDSYLCSYSQSRV